MRMAMRFRAVLILIASILAFSMPSRAQNRDVPYWASLRADEVNLRVGPSADYKVDWVYHREKLPLKVVRVHEGWRRVRDMDGDEGWIVARLLNPERTAMVVGEGLAPMRDAPADNGSLKWNAEPGVIGKLGDCDAGWCVLDVEGRKGWVEQKRLWGAGDP